MKSRLHDQMNMGVSAIRQMLRQNITSEENASAIVQFRRAIQVLQEGVQQTGPEQTAAAADDDYGKSNPDATGIAELEAMQELYKMCFENRTADRLFNYEYAKETLGCDGVASKKASFTWNETKHTYRWETEDGKDFLSISFELEDGQEWYWSCSMSENVINGLW